jgi:hypothetical protein
MRDKNLIKREKNIPMIIIYLPGKKFNQNNSNKSKKIVIFPF